MTAKYATPSLVDLAIRCDCGAAVTGRIRRVTLAGAMRMFQRAHDPKCRKGRLDQHAAAEEAKG